MWRQAIPYAAATYLARAICAVRSVINARVLGPEWYGLWASISFFLTFGYYLHGGAQDIALKVIPMLRSQGHEAQAARVAQQTRSFFGLMLGFAVIGLWVHAWRLPVGTPVAVRAGWGMAAFVLVFEIGFFLEQMFARAQERFAAISQSLLVSSVLSVALTAWLVTRHGFIGLLMVSVFTPVLGLIWLARKGYAWRFVWSWPEIGIMLRAGWPILSMTVVFESLSWIDRAIVLAAFGSVSYGHYALAAMLVQLCFIFPQVMAMVVEPKLYARFALMPEAMAVREHLWVPLRTLAWLMPVGLSALDWLLPMVVRRWLPAYTPALGAMRVLIWASVFMGLAICTKSFIVALHQQRQVLPYYGMAILVNGLISGALAASGHGLIGVAFGTAIAYAVCSIGVVQFACRRLGWRPAEILYRMGSLMAPAVLVAVSTMLVPEWIGHTLASPRLSLAVRWLAWVVCAVIAVIRIWRSPTTFSGAFAHTVRLDTPQVAAVSTEVAG